MLLPASKIQCLRDPATGDAISDLEGFQHCGGQPILVDFKSSLFSSDQYEDFEEFIERRTGKIWRVLSRIVNGDYVKRSPLPSAYADAASDDGKLRVLIVGGGTIGDGLEHFYEDEKVEAISFDVYPSKNTSFVADAHQIPLLDESVDMVVIQAVLEHVVSPHEVVSEIHRVMKTGGIVFSESPFLQSVHEGPYDFYRFTESAHRDLFRDFSCIESGCSKGAGSSLVWALSSFVTGLFRSRAIGRASKLLYFWLQYFDFLIGSRYNIDAGCEFFFIGKKESGPPEFSIVEHYGGAQQ